MNRVLVQKKEIFLKKIPRFVNKLRPRILLRKIGQSALEKDKKKLFQKVNPDLPCEQRQRPQGNPDSVSHLV